MTTLEAAPSSALDASAHEFIATFMSHVATIAGYGTDRRATIARVKMLLLAAIEHDDGASDTAWSALHQAISQIIAPTPDAPGPRRANANADAYLRAFLEENVDLAAFGRPTSAAATWL